MEATHLMIKSNWAKLRIQHKKGEEKSGAEQRRKGKERKGTERNGREGKGREGTDVFVKEKASKEW